MNFNWNVMCRDPKPLEYKLATGWSIGTFAPWAPHQIKLDGNNTWHSTLLSSWNNLRDLQQFKNLPQSPSHQINELWNLEQLPLNIRHPHNLTW